MQIKTTVKHCLLHLCTVFKSNVSLCTYFLRAWEAWGCDPLHGEKKSTYSSLHSSLALGLCGENNKLNASDVCSCGLINLCSKLLHHTISLPIDPQVLWGRAGAKVWRCGTSSGNRPRPNCLFFVSWSYWQLPLSQPVCPSSGKTKQGLLIAMAFSSSQIKCFHTSQERQHLLRPLVKYCKYNRAVKTTTTTTTADRRELRTLPH